MTDKFLHFMCCFLATALTTMVCYASGTPLIYSQLIGLAVGLIIGVGKECYDLSKGYIFDWNDILADVCGSATAFLFAFGL